MFSWAAPVLFNLGPSPSQMSDSAHILGESSHLSHLNLDNPSQVCPEASLLGDTRSCQVDNITYQHSLIMVTKIIVAKKCFKRY